MISIRRILVPTDFSDCATKAVRYAAELADKFGAELVLLHVVPDTVLALPDAVMPAPVPVTDLEALTEAGKVGLANLVTALGLQPRNPRREVRLGAPEQEIPAAAKDLGADLVCVGTHGRGGLARVFLGSVAEQVVRHAHCPVLTVRPDTH
ncbi:Putative universal stress protein [Gemmata obscuriglobus]|uniref:Universal stress protein n=1 Tax=Gemmata obscuriglobus TaxID=114 RepID=A0A2Z3HKA9_9BACT|nr:universal stress protein [Gemmata obscuriglobus]AWM41910.1 universal stress protein [Gemmata obscuriglobus]QEG32114.1 Putative universal stress protein [Gemmata obscuriglobus]VTS11467.1 universal stress protein : Universal stress protein OS=Singulisphaera acidiphila (strain ATCC BAA-1392 / DSM 18658 / VKM B-2454 / MOB10) GN=Sinac_5019 PE=3 SV=1: Usp [Gemmata obscuriglobus UQM 2246]